MSHTLTLIKSFCAFVAVWITDLFVLQLSGLSFFNPVVKEILVECKEIISIIVSITIFILTVIRIRKESKK